MNRAYTVWVDQLSSAGGNSGAVADPSAVQLPSFSLPPSLAVTPPQSKWEGMVRLMQFIWSQKGNIIALIALFKLVKHLRWLMSSSTSASNTPLTLSSSHLFPSFIPSASAPGVWLYTRCWRVPPHLERGRVFLVHAYREHSGRYEAVATALNQAGYSVFSMDHQGHGRSGGDRGYVESFRHFIVDYLEFMSITMAREGGMSSSSSGSESEGERKEGGGEEREKPCFLLGHSAGATIALQIARIQEWRRSVEEREREEEQSSLQPPNNKLGKSVESISEEESWEQEDGTTQSSQSAPNGQKSSSSVASSSTSAASSSCPPSFPRWRIHGLILSCPALIPDGESVSPLLQALASSLADAFPKFGFSTILDLPRLCSEPLALSRFYVDPLIYRGNMCSRFGHEMLIAMADTRNGLSDITLPLLVLQGKNDRIISPQSAQYLCEHASSADITLKLYEARHDLYCEVQPVRQLFISDVTEWLNRQTER